MAAVVSNYSVASKKHSMTFKIDILLMFSEVLLIWLVVTVRQEVLKIQNHDVLFF